MVTLAEHQQIIETGFTAGRPVFYVVGIDEAPVVATWKHTSLVSRSQRAFDRRGHGARLAANTERFALLVFDDDNGIAVTTQAFDGLNWQARAAITIRECRMINVHRDLVVIGGTRRWLTVAG